MSELWVNLTDLPVEGREFSFEDQTLWTGFWNEYGLDCAPREPLAADIFILPQNKGGLITGTIEGSVDMVCDRCAEPFEQKIETKFEIFEALPEEDEDVTEEPRVKKDGGALHLNLGAVLWEQFVLALPQKPVCSRNCKGLCPNCGKNLNDESCECEEQGGDPRMEIFRNMKVSK